MGGWVGGSVVIDGEAGGGGGERAEKRMEASSKLA